MSAPAKTEPSTKTKWKMPAVHIGQMVLWHASGQDQPNPYPAVIYSFNEKTVSLCIYDPSSLNNLTRDGVRHINDPNMQDVDMANSGAWDYTAETKEFRALCARLETLPDQFEELKRLVKAKLPNL